MAEAPLKDQVSLLLLNGQSVEAVVGFCIQRGQDPAQAKALVGEARTRITVAADYTRDEQIALAVTRLNDLYGKAVAGKDYRTALASQKELSRLLCLYATSGNGGREPGDEDTATVRQQVELITRYLLPLKLAAETYPIEEHARIAAETIRQHGLANV